jgi:hypothetical protein
VGYRFASERLVVERFPIPDGRVVWRLASRRSVDILCRRHSVLSQLCVPVVDSHEKKKS